MRRAALLLLATAAGADPAARNEEGLAHLLAGRPAEAAAAFEAALAERPGTEVLERNLAAALAARGEALLSDRSPAEAIPLLVRATILHPERLRYRALLGRARFEAGDDLLRAAARADLAAVLAEDPDHLDALLALGEIAYLGRELEEAVRHLGRAAALLPGDRSVARRLERARRELLVERSFATLSGAHFLLRYSPEIAPERAQAVLVLCEEARGRLSALYGGYPPRISVTLYTPAEFRGATGLHGWAAGLSDGTIRLTLGGRDDPASLGGTVRHELTHHIVRGIAPRAPVWLHEGLAQIEEGRSAAEAEARLRRAGPLPEGLLSAEVLRESDGRRVALFYDAALAFTKHLDDGQKGAIPRMLRDLGAGKDEAEAFRAAFGNSREALFERWRERLK